MLVSKRKTHKFRKRLLWYFLYLLFLGLLVVSYFVFNFIRHPLYVSPIVKSDTQGLDLEKRLKNAKIPFSSIDFSSDTSYIISLTQGGKTIVSYKKNIDIQISSLQRILRELTIEGKSFKSIDFRFEKPVIEFN